jgi:hypothetical protein
MPEKKLYKADSFFLRTRNTLTGGRAFVIRIEKLTCSWTAILLITMVVGGCAIKRPEVPPVVEQEKPRAEGHENGWWKVGFQMKWPEGEEPAWYMDLFLAHSVISPLLDKYRKDILFWRFHRRAARDQSGHQFSFIFYSPASTAQRIYQDLKSNRSLEKMKTDGVILRDIYDDTHRNAKPHVEDTSDPHWSPPIKRSWPYFIMGVSQMWLSLIEDFAEQIGDGESPSSMEGIRIFYEQINGSIIESWQEEGRHAFLHHLNAIFGYKPLVVYEKRLMTF